MQLRQPTADRVLPYTIAVLLLPLLVLWRRTDALYTPLWQADPWFYLGYFRDFVNFKRDLYPGAYYGSRLSWIVPGYLVHSLFSPLIANALLHLTVHSVAALSLFATLRLTVGLRSAYLTAMVFSLHPWLWCATGWDHVNGAGIAYGLLAMALLTRAALQTVRKVSLILAGIALAGSVFAHLFLVAFVPLLLLYYVGLTRPRDYRQAVRSLSVLSLWIGVGFVALTVPLCTINYLVEGSPWFWAPSIKTANNVTQNYTWTESIWFDGKLVPWLWFIVVGVAAAVLLLPARLRRGMRGQNLAGLLFSAQLLLAAALMAYLQGRGITLLGHYYYACYLLPFVFLVIGSLFWPAVDKMRRRTYVVTCCIATLIFGALWYDPASPRWRVPEWEGLLLGGFVLALATLFRERKAGAFLTIAGLALITSAVYTGSYRLVSLHGTSDEYARIMSSRQRIENRRNGAPIQFWYDKQEPGFFEYFALNASYLAEVNRISENFPRGCETAVDPRTLIVVTSQKEGAAEQARSALADCWRPFGTHPTVDSVEVVPNRRGAYSMALLRVEAGASESPPGELFANLPLERIQLAALNVTTERWPEGMAVTTLPSFGAFAVRVPLGLDVQRGAGFNVHVRARVLEGKVGFGILDSTGRTYLLRRPMWPLPSMTDVILPLPAPPITGDLMMCNLTTTNVASTAVIEKIEIRKTP